MNKKKKAVILASMLATGAFFIPAFAKLYCERKYNISVDSAKWVWSGISFHDISLNRENIKVNLQTVTFQLPSGPLFVSGGSISIIKKPSSDVAENKNFDIDIIATGLKADIRYNDTIVNLTNASYTKTKDKNEFAADSGNIIYEGHEVGFSGVYGSKNLDIIHIDNALTKIYLPIKIPALKEFAPEISITDITVWPHGMVVNGERQPKSVFAKLIEYGPFKLREFTAQKSSAITAVAKEIEGNHPWLGTEPVVFHDVGFSAINSKHIKISLGKAVVDIGVGPYSINGSGNCEDWMQAVPSPLPEALKESLGGYSGNLEFEVSLEPSPRFYMKHDCKFKCSTKPIKSLFDSGGFSYTAYNAKGEPFSRHTGIMQPDWTLIDGIAQEMQLAVTTLEDPYFYNHVGIIPSALQNSFIANLQSGKFMRGGSTITMQLAKNLWLTRQKTILRKVQEALLTFALESCLSKEQILEMYLNVVEFGPDIYGIRAASRFYFNKPPHELTAEQSFYLAMILPAPRRAILPDEGGLVAAHGLMKKLAAAGAISDDMVEE